MTLHLADETFRKAISEAFKAGRESGVFDVEMALLGMMPQEGNTIHITNIGDIAHIYTSAGYIRLDSLVDTGTSE